MILISNWKNEGAGGIRTCETATRQTNSSVEWMNGHLGIILLSSYFFLLCMPGSSMGAWQVLCKLHLTKAAEEKPMKNWKAAFQAGWVLGLAHLAVESHPEAEVRAGWCRYCSLMKGKPNVHLLGLGIWLWAWDKVIDKLRGNKVRRVNVTCLKSSLKRKPQQSSLSAERRFTDEQI